MAETLTEAQVLEFLRTHPEFLRQHPDLLAVLAPPARELGDGVVDFQQFQLASLQRNAKALRSKYDGLVDYCRDNLSVQHQVHDAVLRLIRARNLEQLLEVITLDMLALFDLDVVRLAVESEAAEFHENHYTEHDHSGLVFVPTGTISGLMEGRDSLLVDDALARPLPGIAEIFADCMGLVQSYALLRLDMESFPHDVLLAFGVRYKGRFNSSQAIDLLDFLASILALRLDSYLDDLTP